MKKESIIKAQNLCYTYEGEEQPALNGLSLEIKQGKKIAVMGANGSGKSTFFLCLNGILRPQKGTLSFCGTPYSYDKKSLLALRSRVGIVFQDPDNQLFSASVRQEISFGILNLGADNETALRETETIMEELDITEFQDRPTHALSGGQKKQVAIADILVMHPDIVILDEPAAALDPKHTSLVNKIIDRMTDAGITVLLSTHDSDYAFSWADEVILFHQGRVLISGAPEEVFADHTALKAANLFQPAVLAMFESLCRKEIISAKTPVPRNLSELEHIIEGIQRVPVYGGKTMHHIKKKAILAVSFGTSYEDTRKKTIEAIEQTLETHFPEHKIYRAWTSRMIIEKIRKRDGLHIDTVSEAMERMKADGITDVVIQPTHVINGVENDQMKEDAESHRDSFHSISFGAPLLTSESDNETMVKAVASEFSWMSDRDALVLMGHGTTHYANTVYAALDYRFKDMGYKNIFLGTVEAFPSTQSLMRMVKEFQPERVILAPFMIVAGDHARHDMAGDDPDSWYSQFLSEGLKTECVMKGLGEYPGVRELFVTHAEEAVL